MDKDLILKLIEMLVGNESKEVVQGKADNNLYSDYIGKYVICRSHSEGVNAGYVVKADKDGVVLKDARRLHYYKPKVKSSSWYEGVARHGLSEGCRVSEKSEKLISEKYSLTLCTTSSQSSIEEYKTHEQT